MKMKMWIFLMGLLFSFSLIGLGQSSLDLAELHANYNEYIRQNPTPILGLTLNQDVFVPGDSVRFAVWYGAGINDQIFENGVINIDLIDSDGLKVQSHKSKGHSGVAVGQFLIKSDSRPGYYQIAVYSDWMRNSGPETFYYKGFEVVAQKRLVLAGSSPIFVNPEGGNLVADVQNCLILSGGKPNFDYVLKDDQNNDRGLITTDRYGFGMIRFQPIRSRTYRVATQDGLTQSNSVLAGDGIAMEWNTQENTLTVRASVGSRWKDKNIYALIIQAGKIKGKMQLKLADSQAVWKPLVNDFDNGLASVYVIDDLGVLLGGRQVFITGISSIKVSLSFPERLEQRQSVSGLVQIVDAKEDYVGATLSVNVYQKSLGIKRVSEESLSPVHEMWVALQKPIPIDWVSVIQRKKIKTNIYPLASKPAISGTIFLKNNGKACPDSTIVIAYLQKNLVGYEGYTINGRFNIPLTFDFWGEDEAFIYALPKTKTGDEYLLTVDKDTTNLLGEKRTLIEGQVDHPYAQYALMRNLTSSSYQYFGESSSTENLKKQPNEKFEDEFLGADYSVDVQKYVVFPTMVDLLREVVPYVHHRKTNKGSTVRISYRIRNTTKVCKADPLYIIDGYMTRNTNYFLGLLPQDLSFIKILNNPSKLFQLGRLGENGVIFVQTKSGGINDREKFGLYHPVTGFVKPSYWDLSTKVTSDRSPDLRSTVYWNPKVIIPASGKGKINFAASDDIGVMVIQVQGYTKDGRWVSIEKEIEVVPTAKKTP